MTEFDPQAAAEQASERGTFSFIERLTGRNYPTSDVVMYMDEQAAFDRLVLMAELEDETITVECRVEIEKRIEELEDQLRASKYVITLQAFPPEQYDALLAELDAQYPPEFDEHTNVFSGEKVKTEKDNPARTRLLFAMLWAKSIKKITAPDGSVDETVLDNGTAGHIRENFPIAARRDIDIRIQDLRLASAWMDGIQDEGFLATP